MYSVLIVDDEYMILKGLEKIIKWSDYSFEIVKAARNSKQALEFLEDNDVDLIITDVNMPRISGLDLIEMAQDKGKKFEFMILSGYQEFDYVRTGLQLGAIDYILKPVDSKALVASLAKVKNILDSQTAIQKASVVSLNAQMQRLFENDIDRSEISSLFHQLRITPDIIKSGMTVIACNRLNDFSKVEQLCQQYGQVLSFEHNRHLFIGFVGGRGLLLKFVRELEDKCYITGESFITVGETVYDWQNISQSYEQAARLSKIYKFYEKSNKFSNNNLRVDWLKQATLPKVSLVKIKQAIALGEYEQLMDELKSIFSDLTSRGASPSYVRQIAFLVYSELNVKVNFDEQTYQEYVVRINNADDLQSLVDISSEVIKQLFQKIDDQKYSENIKQVMSLIHKDFNDDLSLKLVSDELHLNPDYLGQLFKKEAKMSFSKYLNEYRIQQAQELLRNTNQSIAEIADNVGYTTTAYFYRNFKSICGLSPKEYRKKYI